MVKKFPSQIRYEKNNPSTTFRMKKHEKEKIGQMARKSGKSISNLVRMALLELEKDFSESIKDAEDRKYVEGMNENAIWFYCKKCNSSVYIEPNSERHKEIIKYISKNKPHWTHENCETLDM
jgi:tetrahydrodipicolinate N-succinyltransferase